MRIRRALKLFVGAVPLVILMAAWAAPLFAQDPTVASRRSLPVARDMRYREWILRDLEKKGKRTPAQQQLAWAQIKEDFERIQTSNNNLLAARASNGPFDLKLIKEAAAEINKRAARLNSDLMLPAESADEKSVAGRGDDLQLGTLLSVLDGLIIRFVKNPIFSKADVIDARHAVKARRDLERIIELSDKIRKKAGQSDQK